MSTYRQMIFMVSDLVKTLSDDTIINENHIMFLLNKYRTYLLRQKYNNAVESTVPQSNYQTICADLIEVPMIAGCSDACVCSLNSGRYLRTKKKIPTLTELGNVKVVGSNIFNNMITMVSPERMEFVGYNNWLQNIIYGSVGSDSYLYLTSNNAAFRDIRRVHISAIFEDPLAAQDMYLCDSEKEVDENGNIIEGCSVIPCELFDREFPLEDDLFTQLLSLTIKEILGAAWRMADKQNNASDDLSDIANFVRSYMKKDYNNVIQPENE